MLKKKKKKRCCYFEISVIFRLFSFFCVCWSWIWAHGLRSQLAVREVLLDTVMYAVFFPPQQRRAAWLQCWLTATAGNLPFISLRTASIKSLPAPLIYGNMSLEVISPWETRCYNNRSVWLLMSKISVKNFWIWTFLSFLFGSSPPVCGWMIYSAGTSFTLYQVHRSVCRAVRTCTHSTFYLGNFNKGTWGLHNMLVLLKDDLDPNVNVDSSSFVKMLTFN